VRVLDELAHRARATATEIASELGLDAGYLSRIVSQFASKAMIARKPSEADRRQVLLSLTAQGQKVFAPLNARQDEEIRALLDQLSFSEQRQLLEAMRTVEKLLGGKAPPRISYVLRTPEPGDMGWVVHRAWSPLRAGVPLRPAVRSIGGGNCG
jgi:DNA-binding MarR family transcriptional regulator